MNIIERKFAVEISEQEARLLSEVLHYAYKGLGEEYNKSKTESTWKLAHSAQVFRNDFAGLIGVKYCGEDA